MNAITHTRHENHVTTLPQPAKVDKDGNETSSAIERSTKTFQSINKAKKFMRGLPQHHTGSRSHSQTK